MPWRTFPRSKRYKPFYPDRLDGNHHVVVSAGNLDRAWSCRTALAGLPAIGGGRDTSAVLENKPGRALVRGRRIGIGSDSGVEQCIATVEIVSGADQLRAIGCICLQLDIAAVYRRAFGTRARA